MLASFSLLAGLCGRALGLRGGEGRVGCDLGNRGSTQGCRREAREERADGDGEEACQERRGLGLRARKGGEGFLFLFFPFFQKPLFKSFQKYLKSF